MAALTVVGVLASVLQSATPSNAEAPMSAPTPAAVSPTPDPILGTESPRPYSPVERPESELHKKLAARKPDFGDDDKISKAWSRGEIGVDEYVRNTILRIADPSRLPKRFKSDAKTTHEDRLTLTYALSLVDKTSAETQAWVRSLDVRPGESRGSSKSASPWVDCATPYIQFLSWFTCKRSFSMNHEFDIYYNIDGFSMNPDYNIPIDGLPNTDVSPANGVPDAIDKIEASLRVAWAQYQSMGYRLPGTTTEIYVGFDANNNPGVTFPFGDILGGDSKVVIFLPVDPAEFEDNQGTTLRDEGWYTYLIRHELFHAVQYHYLPNLHFFGNLISINWWMEATAEWAADVVYQQNDPNGPDWHAYARTLDSFLGNPESAVNSSDGLAGSRQYGAFILAQYLAERTGTVDFVRKTWEVMDSKLPLEAIDQVLAGYDLNLKNEMFGFAVANYRLSGKTASLSAFLGSADGYAHTHASTLWRDNANQDGSNNSSDGRPTRSAAKTMSWGDSASGSTRIWPGGASYMEFTPTGTGDGRLSVRVDASDDSTVDDDEMELSYLLVAWNNHSSMTPLRWARADTSEDEKTHDITIKISAGETATLIAVRTDLRAESLKIPNDIAYGQPVNWTASMAREASAGPDSALNTMWDGYANNAGCADWSGGDAAQAVKLLSGKRAWFFSDTFLGNPSKRSTGSETSYIRNSIVMQNGSALRTITGGSTCRETDTSTDFWSRYAKTPVGEGGQFWTGDSMVTYGNEVIKFYYEGVGDENTRGAYARFPGSDLETKTTLAVTPTRLQECSARPPAPVIWGSVLLSHQGYTYIYGWEASGAAAEKSLYLARTDGPDYDLVDQSRWRYFAGVGSDGSAQWTASCAQAKPLQPKAEVDFSVVRINGLFWLVRHTPASAAPGKIVAMPARSPWGFGSEQVDLYTPPETKTNPQYSSVYGARVQPGLLSDTTKIVLSYTVSTSAVNLSCWTRGYSFPDNQYPRFVDIPVSQFVTSKLP
ncbi:hypothetical protein F5972_05025 [Microbispora cellulosiformans]|uniref:Uncharacterized protein n=1 Tax=Microbispora cellulosiformans TaxID=2614688 RepID=A0A5J5K778_9ACTN|nr:hypothetical protein [Microbispora cellulosiformans]KAA9380511.1 hypothetical protein F5972_05025 [Microbispora cellulosiformans]